PRRGEPGPSRSRLSSDEEGDEGVELALRQRREGLRHQVRRIVRLDVRVRLHDRLADELLERLTGLPGLGRQLIEVGPDLRRRSRGSERVTTRAPVARENGLSAPAAALLRSTGDPRPE